MFRPYFKSLASFMLATLLTFVCANQAMAESSDVYIVEFTDKPVNSYSGGVKGFSSTKHTANGKLSLNSPAVKRYQDYLLSLQNEALSKTGVSKRNKIYEYTFSFNGMAARLSPQQAEKMRALGNVLNLWIDKKLSNSSSVAKSLDVNAQ